MSENELRDALSALATPALPPPGASTRIHAGVRRAARRRRLVLGSGVLATGLAVTGGALWLDRPGGDGPGSAAWQPPVSGLPTTTLPYEAPGCPAENTAPDPYGLRGVPLPPLDDVASIRICSYGEDWDQMRVPPREEEIVPSPESLVFDLEGLERQVADLPSGPGVGCSTADYFGNGPVLVVTHRDGSRDSFHARTCLSAERYDDSLVDLGQVYALVMRLLDEQRSSYAYGLPDDPEKYVLDPQRPVPCRQFGETGPVEPGREWLVAGSACGHWAEEGPTPSAPLTEEQLQRLNAAFAEATVHDRGPVDERGFPVTEDDCIEHDDETPHLSVRTQRGDVVDLRESPCGWLHLDGWQPGTSWEIPTTFAELGVDVPE